MKIDPKDYRVGEGAEVVRQCRDVPDVRARVAVRDERVEREERGGPDRGPRPEEDLRRRVGCPRQLQLAAGRPLTNALTGGHGAR